MFRWRRSSGVLALALACALAQIVSGSDPQSGPNRDFAQRPHDPILILISFDGWRWDYIDRHPTPNMHALAARGARARELIPSFPTLTFPNHYTIVTGLYPEHHGIVANVFADPQLPERFTMSAQTSREAVWWRGEPLWATAIRQGRRAATMFWPGTEVAIGGIRPTDWTPYDKQFTTADRVAKVLEWLGRPEAERPAFVNVYFEEVDTAGHDFGPGSPELAAAVAHLDAALGAIAAGVQRLGLDDRTTIVVVSDHGMTPLSPDRVIYLDDYIDPATVDVYEWGGFLSLTPKTRDAAAVDAVYRRLHGKHRALKIYRREATPARLHYRNNPRIAAIIGLADEGWSVTTHERLADGELHAGAHGFDPRYQSMHALFVVAGPGIRRGAVVAPFENVRVYNFLCEVLRLTPAPNDGGRALIRQLLSHN